MVNLDKKKVKHHSTIEQQGKHYNLPPSYLHEWINKRSMRTVVKSLPYSLYHHQHLRGLSSVTLDSLNIDSAEVPNFDWYAITVQLDLDTELDM